MVMTQWEQTIRSRVRDDAQVPEVDDDDMVVVKSEDEEKKDTLEHMCGCAFALLSAKQECTLSAVTVKESSFIFTLAGKTHLIKSVAQIAKSVLTCTDPNLNLESKEASTCIDETASRAQD